MDTSRILSSGQSTTGYMGMGSTPSHINSLYNLTANEYIGDGGEGGGGDAFGAPLLNSPEFVLSTGVFESEDNASVSTTLPVANRLSEEGYYLSAFFLLLIGVFGIFNNVVVLIVMAKNKQLRSPLNLFLINLAVSDLGISLVGNPISLVAAINRGWSFGNHACIIYAFLMGFFGITSICTLMVLSFERYLMISRPWKTSELTERNALLTIMGVWLYSFLSSAPPLAGWGGFKVEGPGISCSIDWETRSFNNTSYIVFLFSLGLGLPVAVMVFSYTNVISTLRQAGSSGFQAGVARAERRVALMVVVMGMTFLFAWMPYAVMALIVAFGDPSLVTPGVAAIPAIFAKSSCLYNPIIYVGLNTQFRSAWTRLLCCSEESERGAVGQTTEKVSLTVVTEQSPRPDHFKQLRKKVWGGRPVSQGSSEMRTLSTEGVPMKTLQLNPVRVQYDIQVSTTSRGEVQSEIV